MIAVHAAALFIAALAGAARAAQPCGGDLRGTLHLIESARYAIAYTTAPDPIPVGRHFVIEFKICARDGAEPVQSVRVDANMPEHRHGMNYKPGITKIGPETYRAEGLLLHMSGRWEITFDVVAGNVAERVTDTMRLD
jgi:hypothetical protein